MEHNVIEHADLLVGKARGVANEQVGNAREHLDAPRVGAGIERGFELVDEGERSRHATGPARL